MIKYPGNVNSIINSTIIMKKLTNERGIIFNEIIDEIYEQKRYIIHFKLFYINSCLVFDLNEKLSDSFCYRVDDTIIHDGKCFSEFLL